MHMSTPPKILKASLSLELRESVLFRKCTFASKHVYHAWRCHEKFHALDYIRKMNLSSLLCQCRNSLEDLKHPQVN